MQKKWLILCTAVLALSVCTGCGDWVARMKKNWELAASMESTGSMESADPQKGEKNCRSRKRIQRHHHVSPVQPVRKESPDGRKKYLRNRGHGQKSGKNGC